jgi:hypothetical protein
VILRSGCRTRICLILSVIGMPTPPRNCCTEPEPVDEEEPENPVGGMMPVPVATGPDFTDLS